MNCIGIVCRVSRVIARPCRLDIIMRSYRYIMCFPLFDFFEEYNPTNAKIHATESSSPSIDSTLDTPILNPEVDVATELNRRKYEALLNDVRNMRPLSPAQIRQIQTYSSERLLKLIEIYNQIVLNIDYLLE